MTGVFITFEGIDKCGKETQIRLLEKFLQTRHISYALAREPGGTNYGEAARRFVQDPQFILKINKAYPECEPLPTNIDLDPAGELFGYLIARSMFAKHIVKPALETKELFIADRCGDSSVAYQGYGNFHGDARVITLIKEANLFALQDVTINRTYLIDIPVEESMKRKGTLEFGGEHDRIEMRPDKYHIRVRNGYLEMAKNEPERFLVIDGTQSREVIAKIIQEDITKLLQKKSL